MISKTDRKKMYILISIAMVLCFITAATALAVETSPQLVGISGGGIMEDHFDDPVLHDNFYHFGLNVVLADDQQSASVNFDCAIPQYVNANDLGFTGNGKTLTITVQDADATVTLIHEKTDAEPYSIVNVDTEATIRQGGDVVYTGDITLSICESDLTADLNGDHFYIGGFTGEFPEMIKGRLNSKYR